MSDHVARTLEDLRERRAKLDVAIEALEQLALGQAWQEAAPAKRQRGGSSTAERRPSKPAVAGSSPAPRSTPRKKRASARGGAKPSGSLSAPKIRALKILADGALSISELAKKLHGNKPLAAGWTTRLANEMAKRGLVVEEEGFVRLTDAGEAALLDGGA